MYLHCCLPSPWSIPYQCSSTVFTISPYCDWFWKSMSNQNLYTGHSFFFFFWSHHMACGLLVPRPGIESRPPAVGLWSPNHWTAWEFPPILKIPKDLRLLKVYLLALVGCPGNLTTIILVSMVKWFHLINKNLKQYIYKLTADNARNRNFFAWE